MKNFLGGQFIKKNLKVLVGSFQAFFLEKIDEVLRSAF